MSRAILASALVAISALVLADEARAHDSRPLALELREHAEGQWTLSVWTPPGQPEPTVGLRGCERERGVFRCAAPPTVVVVDYGAVAPAVSTLVRIRRRSGRVETLTGGPGVGRIPLPPESGVDTVLREFAELGLRHIAAGPDHLLFVLLLVLLVRRPRRALIAVTGFTAAHAITLALSVLGWVRLPPEAVEPAIALSIVILAAELARSRGAGGAVDERPESWSLRHPTSMAFAFGLLHGFGFANALTEAGVPRVDLGPALAGFHLGVELGQLVFVAFVFTLGFALRRLRSIVERAEWLVTYAAGSVAMFWTLDKVAPLVDALFV